MSTNLQAWIVADNLIPCITALGWICEYALTEVEKKTILSMVDETDESLDIWYDVNMTGSFPIELSIARHVLGERLTLQIHCKKNIDPALQAILGLVQNYKLQKISR